MSERTPLKETTEIRGYRGEIRGARLQVDSALAAGELQLLPVGSAISEMLADYAVMREQGRVCFNRGR